MMNAVNNMPSKTKRATAIVVCLFALDTLGAVGICASLAPTVLITVGTGLLAPVITTGEAEGFLELLYPLKPPRYAPKLTSLNTVCPHSLAVGRRGGTDAPASNARKNIFWRLSGRRR